MIDKKVHTREWIAELEQKFQKKDPSLIEKVIKALTLVEQLKITNFDFTFKGGTCLLLLLGGAKRFSIDIDITTTGSESDLVECLNKIIENSIFNRFEESVRTNKREISKKHFKFFYDSVLSQGQDYYVLLDVLFEEDNYAECIDVKLESEFIVSESSPTLLRVPTVDCILGDKLTAFAPETTGIKYNSDKDLEIAKQLFDVGQLFDHCSNLKKVQETFTKIANIELDYRGLKKTTHIDVLNDIFQTSRIISMRGVLEKEKYEELNNGIRKLGGYVLSEKFLIESAVGCSAKAAYLSQVLKSNPPTSLQKYSEDIDLKDIVIEHKEFTKFNKIKKYHPEGFYCWKNALDLLEI